jgi:hypothetical protein
VSFASLVLTSILGWVSSDLTFAESNLCSYSFDTPFLMLNARMTKSTLGGQTKDERQQFATSMGVRKLLCASPKQQSQ